jgi:transcriptional regulator with XRE-family HTH domain
VNLNAAVATVVAELLDSASMTRLELHDLTGVPASTITRFLKAEREFDVRTLVLFAAELSTAPSELLRLAELKLTAVDRQPPQ